MLNSNRSKQNSSFTQNEERKQEYTMKVLFRRVDNRTTKYVKRVPFTNKVKLKT